MIRNYVLLHTIHNDTYISRSITYKK